MSRSDKSSNQAGNMGEPEFRQKHLAYQVSVNTRPKAAPKATAWQNQLEPRQA